MASVATLTTSVNGALDKLGVLEGQGAAADVKSSVRALEASMKDTLEKVEALGGQFAASSILVQKTAVKLDRPEPLPARSAVLNSEEEKEALEEALKRKERRCQKQYEEEAVSKRTRND